MSDFLMTIACLCVLGMVAWVVFCLLSQYLGR